MMMETVVGDTADPNVEPDFRRALKYEDKIEKIERFAFYERAKGAFAIVVTGEVCLHFICTSFLRSQYE